MWNKRESFGHIGAVPIAVFAVNFHFCPLCGSTVFWGPERKPDAVGVAVGSFADPAFPSPSQSVYDERRHAWVPPLPPHK
jgi:hypothetical protein